MIYSFTCKGFRVCLHCKLARSLVCLQHIALQDKMIPPDGRRPRAGEDNVLAFFECVSSEQLGPLWREKLKHSGTTKVTTAAS
jgi:hypothetical protein